LVASRVVSSSSACPPHELHAPRIRPSHPLLAGAGLIATKLLAQSAAPPSPPLSFQGAHLHNIDHLEPNANGEGFRLSRVPHAVWEKMNAMGKTRSMAAAGAELRFNLVGAEARVTLKYVENRGGKAQNWPVLAELYQGDNPDALRGIS
jgi:hypothetical protein